VIKLVFRALKYICRIFKKGILIAFLYPFFKLSCFRHKKIISLSPIFIVGAPRSGSTIFYQALTNCYDVKYIDNLASSWFKYLPFGMWLSDLIYGMKPHNNFLAELGNTLKFGGHAPSECGEFWYRWLPRNSHFIGSSDLSEKALKEICIELDSIMSKYSKPLLFKNLNMGQRLQLIQKIYPKAKVIFIRRDPRFIVRSILSARANLNLSENEWWSVRPKNYEKLIQLPELEMCASQVYFIEKQIKEDLKIFDRKNVMTIHFNDLVEKSFNEIASFLCVDRKKGSTMPSFRKDKITSLTKDELDLIEPVIDKYGFEKELFI